MPRGNPFEVLPPSGLGRSRVVRNFQSFEYGDSSLDTQDTGAPTLKHQAEGIRLQSVGVVLLLVVIVLFGRSLWLQVVHGATFRDAAEHNRVRIVSTPAPRGIIFDRNRTPLVENVAEFTVALLATDLPKATAARTTEVQAIAPLLQLSADEVQKVANDAAAFPGGQANIREHVTYDEALRLRILLQGHPAVQVAASARRRYLESASLGPVLGYTGKISDTEWKKLNATPQHEYNFNDVIGKTGLESMYEAELRGKSEEASVEVNAQRREQKVLTAVPAVPGENLVTTIDIGLQQVLADALTKAIKPQKTGGGAAVAIDPKTGGILALVSAPSYDANAFVEGIGKDAYQALLNNPRRPLFFRAIAGEYPSGSTIKPVIAAAALDQGIITPQTTVLSTGGIRIDKWYFPDWKAGGHGVTNVSKAIAESVNTFFYMIGGGTDTFQGLGIDRMTQYARAFDFGGTTGVDLPGERPGFLPSKAWKEQTKGEPWYIGDTYHFAIGQGDLLVTPLQMALMTATMANGGTVYKPHLAAAFVDSDGNVRSTVESEKVRVPVQNSGVIQTVQQGMRQAVTAGSARALQSLSVPAAGKTGTAQFGTGKSTHAWFIGYAPYENPSIAIAVIVEGGGEGHAVALPVAKAGMQYWFSRSKTP